jgi:hypothetical protein
VACVAATRPWCAHCSPPCVPNTHDRYEAGSVVVHSEISVTDEAAGEAAAALLTGGAGVATLESELGEAYGALQVGDAEVVVSSRSSTPAGLAPTPGPAPGEAPAGPAEGPAPTPGPAPGEAPAAPANGPASGPANGPASGPATTDSRIETCSVGFAGCTEMRLAYGKAFCGMRYVEMCQGCVLTPHQQPKTTIARPSSDL